MTANVITYRGRSAAREMGKALVLMLRLLTGFQLVATGSTGSEMIRSISDFAMPV